MPRTDLQQAASRLNGSRSRGPKTLDGRRSSSRNATKHGLTGQGKSLPPDMEQELQSEITLFSNQFHPRTPYEHDLIRRAALGNLRSRRIAETLNALTDDRVRNATRDWDLARASEIARLASQLKSDPAATLHLRQSAEGCDFLADSLESLALLLESQTYLDRFQSRRLLNLLGHLTPPEPGAHDPSDPRADLWACLLALRVAHDPTAPFEPLGWPNLDAARADLPHPSDALESLLHFLRSEITTLESQASTLWQTHDLPSRDSAAARAAFDSSPDLTRLDRYLRASERLRRQSLDELHRLRRSAPSESPSPDEPSKPAIPTPVDPASVQDEPSPHPTPVAPRVQNKPDTPTRLPSLPTHTPRLSALDHLFAPPPTVAYVPLSIGQP